MPVVDVRNQEENDVLRQVPLGLTINMRDTLHWLLNTRSKLVKQFSRKQGAAQAPNEYAGLTCRVHSDFNP